MTVHFGDGTGQFPTSHATALPFPTDCGFAAADLDADGHMDLVTSAETVQGEILYGDGTGGFPATQPIHTANLLGAPGECNNVLVEQIDGSGEPDVAFISGLPGPDRDPAQHHVGATLELVAEGGSPA